MSEINCSQKKFWNLKKGVECSFLPRPTRLFCVHLAPTSRTRFVSTARLLLCQAFTKSAMPHSTCLWPWFAPRTPGSFPTSTARTLALTRRSTSASWSIAMAKTLYSAIFSIKLKLNLTLKRHVSLHVGDRIWTLMANNGAVIFRLPVRKNTWYKTLHKNITGNLFNWHSCRG